MSCAGYRTVGENAKSFTSIVEYGTIVHAHLAGRMVELTADLGLGEGTAALLTTDLSPAYIVENMRTS